MRANSSISSLIVVVLAAMSGCRPADEPLVVAPPTPEPAPAPSLGPPQAGLDAIDAAPIVDAQRRRRVAAAHALMLG